MSAAPLPALRGPRVLLRSATTGDAAVLTTILAEPDVVAWWGATTIAEVADELRTLASYAIVVDGAVSGWLQVHEERDPSYPSVAFDIALTTAMRGHGLGAEALRVAVDHFISRGHHRFTTDPAVDNQRAIRAYERVGFRAVGVMRAYERAPDGSWRDALLMDLLASDLR